MSKYRITIDELYKRDKGVCHTCLRVIKKSEATRDHIIPQSEGGTDSPSNLALACVECNEWRMSKKLKLKPTIVHLLSPEDVDDYERGLIPAWQLKKLLKNDG